MQPHSTTPKTAEGSSSFTGTMETREQTAAQADDSTKVRVDPNPEMRQDAQPKGDQAILKLGDTKLLAIRASIEEPQPAGTQSTTTSKGPTRPTGIQTPEPTVTATPSPTTKPPRTHTTQFLRLRRGASKIAFIGQTRIEKVPVGPATRPRFSRSQAPSPESRPTGIVKKKKKASPSSALKTQAKTGATPKPKPKPKPKKGREPTLDSALDSARQWLVNDPTSYVIRNPTTGCTGMSRREPEPEPKSKPDNDNDDDDNNNNNSSNSRPELIVAHTDKCACLDVRMLHICEHVDRLLRRPQGKARDTTTAATNAPPPTTNTTTTTNATTTITKGIMKQKRQKRRLARRSRDALILALKLDRELEVPVPEDVRFPAIRKQERITGAGARRLRREIAAQTKVVRVVERYKLQRLVERWRGLRAFRERGIWLDW